MDTFNQETIKTLTELSRISCTENEQASLLIDLKKIVAYMETLAEVDTTGVDPCLQVVPHEGNIFREDAVGETLSRDIFLNNAPAKIGGLVKVPPVMKPK